MNNVDLNSSGSSKVMADIFMVLTILLISTSVILPKTIPVADENPPDDVVWQELYKTNDETCINGQCFSTTSQALAQVSSADYLLISISKTASSDHLFELVQYAQLSNFTHIFLEKE